VASARNHGLARAQGEIVAFIDDDVEPDAAWLRETVQAFGTNPRVACVTGLIFPKELETPAQVWFEQFVRFQKGFSRRVFDLQENRPTDPMFPYAIGTVGSGANFAFRTDVLRRIRGFDPALGTGSPAQGGEDLEVLFRLIQAGYAVCYEPRSMVFHSHPRDYEAVRRRSYIYGLGLTAFLLKCVLDEPRRVVEIAERMGPALSHVFGRQSAKNNRQAADFPIELRLQELKGMAIGPLAYIQSRIRCRTAVA
jgi:cellulose synthase/poly-beta-1,6-N-acetylglucosamine synthase-like glycosyltransferase